jgi:hypothetical protein
MAAQGDDRVRPLTRGVSYAIMPFLLVAFAVLYPWPTDTGRLFAWQIKPTLTAMVLASAYLGGAYFFLRAGASRSWQAVKGGFVPVGVFASLLGVATIVHWNKFLHSHVAFWLWAILYFTTPFLVFTLWWRNRRHDPPPAAGDLLLSRLTARLIGVVGGLALVTGLFLFLLPGQAVRFWPWTLTPLTARVLGAIFCLGLAGLGALVDRRWRSARVPFQVAGVMLILILVAGVRAHRQLAADNALTWLFAAGFVGVPVAMAVVYGRMEARARAGDVTAVPVAEGPETARV